MTIVAMMHGDGDYGMGGFMGGWIALWGLLALALIVLTVVATVWLVKHLSSSGSSGSDDQRILERRYAAGDIDREEFLQRRDDLAGRR
jgi:putative membrane protein